MSLLPLGDRIIVRPHAPVEVTVGGVHLPDVAHDAPQRGDVLAVGRGVWDAHGNRHRPEVTEGDVVYFSKYGGTEVKLEGEELLILRENDILAVVE